MSVGYAPDERDIGTQPGPPPVSATPGNDLAAPTFDAPQPGTMSQAPPQSGTAPATPDLAAAPVLPELGQVPESPILTGDPAQDVQLNLGHQRALAEYGARLQAHRAALDTQAAGINSQKAARELAAEQDAQKKRDAERATYEAQRKARQEQIDSAIEARAAAAKDLEGHDSTSGGQLVAIIAGGIGAALQNYGAAQQGHVGNAQNEALAAIDAINARDYQRKKDRLQGASDALLQARYGFKDATENHLAALNDIDADMATRNKLIGSEAEAQLRRAGVPAAEIATNAIVLDARQKQAAAEAAIHEREEKMQIEREGHQATNKLAEAHLGLQERQIEATQGSRRDTLSERRWEHEQAMVARLDAQREKKEAKGKAQETKDEERTVTVGGKRTGLINTPRNAVPFETRAIQYQDAIESLKTLLKNKGVGLPMGDDYNRAVLAVAATTTANASDSTTVHEANTLKNYGLVSEKAIKQTLEHLERRQKAFYSTLAPLPGHEKVEIPGDEAKPTLSDADVKKLQAVPKDDPRYGKAQAVLKANGK